VISLEWLWDRGLDSRLEEIAFDWDVHVSDQDACLMGEDDDKDQSKCSISPGIRTKRKNKHVYIRYTANALAD
jgi:hypothetical protein